MTIRESLKKACAVLKNSDTPSLDAYLMLSCVLEKNKLYLMTHMDDEINSNDMEKFFSLVKLREKAEPIAYILGHREFYGREFLTSEGVLIPRFDTENLIECVKSELEYKTGDLFGLEIGVGSGIISVTLLKEIPSLYMNSIDINPEAIALSMKNAERLNVSNRFKVSRSDIFSDVSPFPYDLIVSNPPYIKTSDIQNLMNDVKDYEPINALDGGADGLNFYRRILNNIDDYSKSGTVIVFEIGFDQAQEVSDLIREHDFTNIKIKYDIQSYPRCISGIRK